MYYGTYEGQVFYMGNDYKCNCFSIRFFYGKAIHRYSKFIIKEW